MNRHGLIAMIAIILIGFILLKGAATYLCEPKQNNPVANVISSVIPEQEVSNGIPKADPLSWEPLLNHLIHFLSKACPK